MMDPEGQVMGPFNINGDHFGMEVINETVYINDAEKWRIQNNTGIAHPFHIHDIQFTVDNINGGPVPLQLQGLKDVVMVMPMSYVEVIAEFKDFADNDVPYMYHCHMLHHEDDGMMGSFRVIDTNATDIQSDNAINFLIYPNPAANTLFIQLDNNTNWVEIKIVNILGEVLYNRQEKANDHILIDTSELPAGTYTLNLETNMGNISKKIIIVN